VASTDLGEERVTDHGSGADETADQGFSVVGAGRLQRTPSSRKVLRVASGSSTPPSTTYPTVITQLSAGH